MKQMEKLGLSGPKVLSDDQMKDVKGGDMGFSCSANRN